jgi:uncharacterized protein YjbI with pentapeptide repeats
LLRRGPAAVNGWRDRNPDGVLDLSDMNLSGFVLENANLSRANLRGVNLSNLRFISVNFQGADLSSARIEEAHFPSGTFAGANVTGANLKGAVLNSTNFRDANLSNADFTGATLVSADLAGATVTGAVFKGVNLQGANLNVQKLCEAKLAGAQFGAVDLKRTDLSSCDLTQTNFSNAMLSDANFSRAKLERANLSSANLENVNLYDANLTGTVFSGASLVSANLRRAKLIRANITQANLNKADIHGADFYEATLDSASMELVRGASSARNLLTTRINQDVVYFRDVERSWTERFLDWERIRVVGRLPLFGASYTGLIIIPVYVYLLGIYNEKLEAAGTWIAHTAGTASGLPSSVANAVLAHLHPERVPRDFFVLFISTIFLAVASTIYIAACPSRIKEFSRDQWCDELGRSLVHYWPEAWKFPLLRLTSATLYVVGGLGASYVLLKKLWRVAVILYHSS